jgi:hypothetical protein
MPTLKTISVEDTLTGAFNSDPDTLSVEVADKPDRVLVLLWTNRFRDISSASYNGDALTRAKKSSRYDGCQAEVWYLVNPDAGTHTLSINFSDTPALGDRYAVMVLSNCDVNDLIEDTDEQTGNGSSYSKSLTTKIGGLVIHGFQHTGTSSGNKGAGETLLWEYNSNDSNGGAYEIATSTPVTVSYNGFSPGDSGFSACMVSFNPASLRGGGAVMMEEFI